MPTRRKLIRSGVLAGTVGIAGCSGNGNGNGGGNGNGNGGGNGNGNGGGNGGGNGDGEQEVAEWQWATSVEGGPQFIVGNTVDQYLNDSGELDGVLDLDAVVAPGAVAGYRMMDDGDVELSGPSNYDLSISPDGGQYSDSPIRNFDSVRQLFASISFQVGSMVVTQDSGIETWEDLEGKTISLGDAGSATARPLETLVDNEIGLENVDVQFITWSEQPSALRGGQVDAISNLVTNSELIGGFSQEMDSTIDWTAVNIPESGQEFIESELPYADVVTLTASDLGFETYTDDLVLLSLAYPAVGLAELDAEVVYELTRVCQESADDLQERSVFMRHFGDPDLNLGNLHPEIPVHKGAYDYYRDQGIWEDYDLTPPPEA